MPNGVKYSTTTPSGSLRRDNVALGVNGNLGPTANTGFYSMPTPASGKYIINKVAASGVPNFFAPQNDTELIQFARNEGATGADTGSAAAVLSWIATQPNLEAANFEYEGIVTDGLVLNLDAGFVGSYPTINTTWYDISGNANNGALINGPTFNSANSGSIVFDGVDDYYIVNNNPSLDCVDGVSVFCWCKMSTTAVKQVIMKYNGINVGIAYGFQFWENGYVYYHITTTSGWKEIANPIKYSTNTWYYIGLTYNKSTLIGYTNGASSVQSSHTGNITTNPYGVQMSTGQSILTVSDIQIYNRALSATEVLQNYNAQKGRFGL
jgi:hypothetical protein